MEFVCDFYMGNYPFDTQNCYAEIEIANPGEFIELETDNMTYIGPNDVMQYVITDITKFYKKDEKVVLKISLGRRLLSVILTTMLPTGRVSTVMKSSKTW